MKKERDYQKDLEICEKATPGEWNVRTTTDNSGDYPIDFFDIFAYPFGIEAGPVGVCRDMMRGKDAEFIATARTSLPWYIRRCMELEAENGRLREALEAAKVHLPVDATIYGNDVIPGKCALCSKRSPLPKGRGSV